MLTVNKPAMMWAWICPVTGIVWKDGMEFTEPYATSSTERTLGKRRAKQGDMRLVRVTIEPASEEETAAHRAEFAAWKARKDSERSKQAASTECASGADAGRAA